MEKESKEKLVRIIAVIILIVLGSAIGHFFYWGRHLK